MILQGSFFTSLAGSLFWQYLEVTGVFRHNVITLQVYDVLLNFLLLFSHVIVASLLSEVCNSELGSLLA